MYPIKLKKSSLVLGLNMMATGLMDILSIIGVLVSVSTLLLGNLLGGGEIGSLVNVPALIIVFGGTIGATLLQFPPVVFIRSLEMFLWIFKPG
jgi:chemotaxis protein MotA